MISLSMIRRIVADYLDDRPGQWAHLAPLNEALACGANIIDPDNMIGGHIAAQAVVVAGDQVLTVGEGWHLPGGHLHPGDLSVRAAAVRWVFDTTGLAQMSAMGGGGYHRKPVDIAVQTQPATGDTPAHTHYVIRYGFVMIEPVRPRAGGVWRAIESHPDTKLRATLSGLVGRPAPYRLTNAPYGAHQAGIPVARQMNGTRR